MAAGDLLSPPTNPNAVLGSSQTDRFPVAQTRWGSASDHAAEMCLVPCFPSAPSPYSFLSLEKEDLCPPPSHSPRRTLPSSAQLLPGPLQVNCNFHLFEMLPQWVQEGAYVTSASWGRWGGRVGEGHWCPDVITAAGGWNGGPELTHCWSLICPLIGSSTHWCPSMPSPALGAGVLPEWLYWTQFHLSDHNTCFCETHRHHQVWEVLLLGIWPLHAEMGTLVRWGDYTINRTDPAPPLAHSPPHHLIPPLSQDIESPVHTQHPQDPSCKATKMSRLCLSAALLLGTLMTSTPVGDISCKDNGKSWLISPLQTGSGMMRGVHGRGWGAGMGWTLPTLSRFLLRNWAVLTPGMFADSQKKSHHVSSIKIVSCQTIWHQGPHLWDSLFLVSALSLNLTVVQWKDQYLILVLVPGPDILFGIDRLL